MLATLEQINSQRKAKDVLKPVVGFVERCHSSWGEDWQVALLSDARYDVPKEALLQAGRTDEMKQWADALVGSYRHFDRLLWLEPLDVKKKRWLRLIGLGGPPEPSLTGTILWELANAVRLNEAVGSGEAVKCLLLGGSDPTAELSSLPPATKPGSYCQEQGTGVVIDIESIRRLDLTDVVVKVTTTDLDGSWLAQPRHREYALRYMATGDWVDRPARQGSHPQE